MAFPRAAGHPDYTNDGTSKFIPEIWSGKLVENLYDASVLSDITNTDYEGEIKGQGDRVVIRTVPTGTVSPYVKGMNLQYTRLESPSIQLLIDKGYYWAYAVDKVDKYQSDVELLNRWAKESGEAMRIQLDTTVLSSIYADAHAKNTGLTAGFRSGDVNLGVTGTPLALTKTNVIEVLADVEQVLDEQNVPQDGRFIVLPAWACTLIKKSDLKDSSMMGDGVSVIRNGRIGTIHSLQVFKSNLLTIVSDGGKNSANCIFGHKMATTFATQIVETESLKAESTFGEMIRGLNVFGFKVVKPEALGNLYAYKG